jgi:glucan biosynthesis protein
MVDWTVEMSAWGDADIMVHARLAADTASRAWKIVVLCEARKWMDIGTVVLLRARLRVRWVC